jgi:hypothetical protein
MGGEVNAYAPGDVKDIRRSKAADPFAVEVQIVYASVINIWRKSKPIHIINGGSPTQKVSIHVV